MKEDILTLEEVSQYLKLSKDTVYRMAQQGRIPGSKVGRAWRFKKERVDQWFFQQEKECLRNKPY